VARLAGLLNVADISATSGIPQTSLHRYLSLLQALFIYQPLRAYSANPSKRLSKSPKVFFNDSGLAANLLGLNDIEHILSSSYIGSILENFVFTELMKQMTWSKGNYTISHFRTHKGVEVDFILERPPSQSPASLIGIEVKAASSVSYDDFKGLRYLAENFEKQFYRGFVLYCGDEIISFGKNMWCLPMNCLWTPS
jgi:predicted AAA+ superfamily ATPase